MSPRQLLPILSWAAQYNRTTLARDLLAAMIVTVLLIPQSLAYAMLAGLPAEVGLYASIVPLTLYALFGTSSTLAVGPVAVISLMTASAASSLAEPGTPAYTGIVLTLAFLSGLILLGMAVARLGLLANFLSHPVISGFITASALIIAAGQLGPLLGIEANGQALPGLLISLWRNGAALEPITAATGLLTLLFLAVTRRWLQPQALKRATPLVAVGVTTLVSWWAGLAQEGVAVVGAIPTGLPGLTLPAMNPSLWRELGVAALLISIVGFVESVSIAETLATHRRERLDPDQELLGLGASNLGAAFSGGMPVTGGFSRSAVNADAGAATPAAGAFTAVGIGLTTLTLTPLLTHLPRATLAATIIVAVMSLIDTRLIRRTWRYAHSEFTAMLATIALTLILGVETGILTGVGLSLALHLYRTSQPHSAVIGRVPGTEHFRNVERYQVETDDQLLMVRVDESLYFANARPLEERLLSLAATRNGLRHVVLACQAVNDIDTSALETLETINRRLGEDGIQLHLAEVKGPVKDRLHETDLLTQLTGQVFLSTYEAWLHLHHNGPANTRQTTTASSPT